MGHTAWAPEGREGRYQAGPKGRNLEVFNIFHNNCYLDFIPTVFHCIRSSLNIYNWFSSPLQKPSSCFLFSPFCQISLSPFWPWRQPRLRGGVYEKWSKKSRWVGSTCQSQIACRSNPSTDSYLYLKIALTDPFCPLKLCRTTAVSERSSGLYSLLQISLTS